jgi:hypothetical protein
MNARRFLPADPDRGVTTLLFVQTVMLFLAIPLSAQHPAWHVVLDAGHLIFAGVAVAVLTNHRAVQGVLLAALALLAIGPIIGDEAAAGLGIGAALMHETIAATAFVFNGLVTVLVARHVFFGAGRVTTHRLRGAILIYLNIASLFAIIYGIIATHAPGAIMTSDGHALPTAQGARTAAMTYFSLAMITTSSFGDILPVHPLARSLANLESVFGQLFPATLLAGLVALHLAHRNDEEAENEDVAPED